MLLKQLLYLCEHYFLTDYDAMELQCVQKACYDKMIGIKKVLKPDTIQVHGIRDIDEYALQLHFERENVSGGGKVLAITYTEEEDDCCLVQFSNNEGLSKSFLFEKVMYIKLKYVKVVNFKSEENYSFDCQ